jgi:2-aminoadipate transaminase
VGEVLLDPGDLVVCAAPSYFVFLGMIESLGATTVGVEADEYGIVPEALDGTLTEFASAGKAARVKAVYVTSYFDNPAGVSVANDRRPALVDIARRHKVYLIEDVAYRELRYHGEDLPSLRCYDTDGSTVIQAGTFSKSFSPGIRIGWGILPPALVAPVLIQKGHLDFGSANFNQILMAEVFARGQFDSHMERLRSCYRGKMAAAVEAVDEFLGPIHGVEYQRPDGGLYVWLRLPESIDTGLSGPLFDRAVREGVLYVPGEVCYPRAGVPAARNTIRLSFGIQSSETIRTGVELLARAIRSVG